MTVRILLLILSILNGGYMLADGMHVALKGKFIGPQKPGPWASVFYKLDVNVYKMGPFFITFGILWLAFVVCFWMNLSFAYPLGLFMSLMTLWYIPLGTLISIAVFTTLYITKSEAGF